MRPRETRASSAAPDYPPAHPSSPTPFPPPPFPVFSLLLEIIRFPAPPSSGSSTSPLRGDYLPPSLPDYPPSSLSLSLPPRLCSSAALPLGDYLLSLWGDSSSPDLCPSLSLPVFYPRKSTLPFRLPLTGERGENVVVIRWVGVSSSAVISVVVRVLQASGCRCRRGGTRDGCAELGPEFSLWRCAPYAGKYLHPSRDFTSDGDEGEPTWISGLKKHVRLGGRDCMDKKPAASEFL